MELIEDGRTGYLIDGFGADAIEQRLRWVFGNFDPEVGRRASAIVHHNNSLDRAVELESKLSTGSPRFRARPRRRDRSRNDASRGRGGA